MSLYPENPPGQAFVSQDTYASEGVSLSGLGGGGTVGPVLNGVRQINADPNTGFLINQPSAYPVSLQNNDGDNEIRLAGNGAIQLNYSNDYGVTIDPTGRIIEIYNSGGGDPEGALEGISTINGTAVSAFTGAVPANLVVSSLTVNGSSPAPIVLTTNIDAGFESGAITFNSDGQDTAVAGQLAINKGEILSLGLTSTLSGLAVNALSTGYGQYQPIAAKSIILAGDFNDGTYKGAEISYTNTTSTLSMYAPKVNVSSLVGVSSINGTAYSSGGSVPANLNVSSLNVNGAGAISLITNASFPNQSAPIVFQSAGQTTEAQGVVSLSKNYMSGYGLSTIAGLAVFSLSTGAGLYQPISVGGIVIDNPYTTTGPSASLTYNNVGGTLNLNAPNVNVSSLVGVSSINGTAYSSGVGIVASGIILRDTIAGATWESVGTLGQFAYSFNIGITLNSDANVQVTTWDSDADEASTYWVVSSGLDSGLLRIVLAGNPSTALVYNLSWVVLTNAGTPP